MATCRCTGRRRKRSWGRRTVIDTSERLAEAASAGVDVFIYWSAFRRGDACDWYPGFSPGTHNESTHAENEPNYAAVGRIAIR
jgi:hypothetical protein